MIRSGEAFPDRKIVHALSAQLGGQVGSVENGESVMKKQKGSSSREVTSTSLAVSFAEVVDLIQQARQRAFHAVNTDLIDLYWQVGEYISQRIDADGWGKSTISSLASYIRYGPRTSTCVVSPLKTSGGCANFMRPIATSQNSRHW